MSIWVIKHHRPFAIVDDAPLSEAFQMLYAKVKVPSANTVSRNVREIHDLTKANVIALLGVCALHATVFPMLIQSYLRCIKVVSILLSTAGHHPMFFRILVSLSRMQTTVRSARSSLTSYGEH